MKELMKFQATEYDRGRNANTRKGVVTISVDQGRLIGTIEPSLYGLKTPPNEKDAIRMMAKVLYNSANPLYKLEVAYGNTTSDGDVSVEYAVKTDSIEMTVKIPTKFFNGEAYEWASHRFEVSI